MPTGTDTIDFGAFPGSTMATKTITGQTAIASGSLVEAWIRAADSADHLADEHKVESIRFVVGDVVAGTGFTVTAFDDNPIQDALGDRIDADGRVYANAGGNMIHGVWNFNWAWV